MVCVCVWGGWGGLCSVRGRTQRSASSFESSERKSSWSETTSGPLGSPPYLFLSLSERLSADFLHFHVRKHTHTQPASSSASPLADGTHCAHDVAPRLVDSCRPADDRTPPLAMSFRSKITFRKKNKSKRVRSNFKTLSIVCIFLFSF